MKIANNGEYRKSVAHLCRIFVMYLQNPRFAKKE